MVEIIESQSLREKTKEKAREVFRILEENGLFVKKFFNEVKFLTALLGAEKLEENREIACILKKGNGNGGIFSVFTGETAICLFLFLIIL